MDWGLGGVVPFPRGSPPLHHPRPRLGCRLDQPECYRPTLFTSTGNCPEQGINGTVVRQNCTNILGVTTTVSQSTTNATGFFNISLPSITGILFGLPTIPCVVSVQLPSNATVCPVLSTTTGVLASAVQSVGTVVNTTVGAPLNRVITGFIRLMG
ncbi:hypothetical protein Salat_1147200 [Sesamum alatum]|uniref:Pollen Ole e 1 allergen and extensin family protein n=1 Tax=Sesamum alatum TaxID=300844 RepID=A0AAE1YEM6_9LAMI|nr:hypothetical protein Salat_1147200 [Sesamum alatum]